MVTIPLAEGYLYSFGSRSAVSSDTALAKHGVEAYLIDSRTTACNAWPDWPAGFRCSSSTRRACRPLPHRVVRR